ncbi:type III effector protein [Streptomyces sp. NPDC047928]|uniref:type III effector protein n=1 Tax=unclassified Streptomyces TaxID=2593676 RepID=UPI00372497AE
MSEGDEPARWTPAPASFLAAAAALSAIDRAVRAAQGAPPADAASGQDDPEPEPPGPEQALAALLLLREVRGQLAGWEPGLIETARAAGASWADLAGPLGVTSRQAAERRYLRLRPGDHGATGEERIKATRDRRAADRTVTAWARGNAAGLRQLAGQITALDDLPRGARTPVRDLARALADDDAAGLVEPLADTGPHLRRRHPELAARVADVTRRADELRRASDDHRRTIG